MLAMFRENEKVLSLSIRPPETEALELLRRFLVRSQSFAGEQVALAAEDSTTKRLLAPSGK